MDYSAHVAAIRYDCVDQTIALDDDFLVGLVVQLGHDTTRERKRLQPLRSLQQPVRQTFGALR